MLKVKSQKSKVKSIGIIFVVLMLSFNIFSNVYAVEFLRATMSENPYNKTAQQLRDKEKQLSEREMALNALQKKMEGSFNVVMAISGGLFFLILINFVMDVRRKKNTLTLVNK